MCVDNYFALCYRYPVIISNRRRSSLIEINIVGAPKDIDQAQKGFCFFSKERLDKTENITHTQSKLLSCAAELAICLSLNKLGLAPACGGYTKDKKGRPVCEKGYISVSHSGEFALCAVSEKPVGVDIEKQRILTEKASRYILGDDKGKYENNELLRIWTVKEAFSKLTGEGLRFPLGKITLHSDGSASDGETKAFSQSFLLDNGYQLSVCSSEQGETVKIKEFSYNEAVRLLTEQKSI